MQGLPLYRVLGMMAKRIIGLLCGVLLIAGCQGLPKDFSSGTNKVGKDGDDKTSHVFREEDHIIGEYDAIVTVKKSAKGNVYFQVDSTTCVFPLGCYEETFTGIKRLACHLIVFDIVEVEDFLDARITWYENIEKGELEKPEETQQNCGLDMLEDWLTSVEDGFLTLHYSAWWGDSTQPHRITLARGDHPFELFIKHYNNGDEALREADALIYFDLNDILPQTTGNELTLKWITCDGTLAQKTFRYSSRTE